MEMSTVFFGSIDAAADYCYNTENLNLEQDDSLAAKFTDL